MTRAIILRCSTLVVMLTAAFALGVGAEERAVAGQPLKLSTAVGPAYPLGKAGDIWASLIRDRSGGRLAVTYSPGATLVSRDPTREFAALRDRAIDLAVGSTLTWSAVVPQLNVLALPWIVPGPDELEALLGGDIGARLAVSLESSGVIALAWTGNGFVDLASAVPVRKPSDLVGLRVRAHPSPLITETLAALAAQPSAMSAANARVLLDNGQLDAEEISVPGYSASQLSAGPLKHLLLWQAHADAMVFAVNRAVWDAWSEADRTLVRGAALDASRQVHAMVQRLADDKALARLGSQGAIMNRLTVAGRAAFREAVGAVYDRWTPVIGSDLVETAKAAASAVPQRQ